LMSIGILPELNYIIILFSRDFLIFGFVYGIFYAMKCPKCGSENSDGALYCGVCYEVFRKEPARPKAAEPAPAAPEKVPAFPAIKVTPDELKSAFSRTLEEFGGDLAWFWLKFRKDVRFAVGFVAAAVLSSLGMHFSIVYLLERIYR
jgi:hypothetical protein